MAKPAIESQCPNSIKRGTLVISIKNETNKNNIDSFNNVLQLSGTGKQKKYPH